MLTREATDEETAEDRPRRTRPPRLVMLGFGAIHQRVATLLRMRGARIAIAGVIDRNPQSQAILHRQGLKEITTEAELTSLAPDLFLEAASKDAVRQWAPAALRCSKRVIISSTSALIDDEFLSSLRRTADRSGSRLVLSPGALAGVEALAAASRLRLSCVEHRIVKPPSRWAGAGMPSLEPAMRNSPTVIFKGSAREAARRFPQNANVTVITALSTIGMDAVSVELVADPQALQNRHEVRASGDFGTLTITLENRPLTANPKSSELAALALVRLAENEAGGLVI